MKKIAITGGIASGKSAVSSIIEKLGGYVIYTDKINEQLLREPEYMKKLSKIFENAVCDGVVNKSIIRAEILQNESKREQLNSLAHKEITLRVENLVKKFNGKTIFCEIPLIVESGMMGYFDEIWCVVANKESKIKRIITRDNVTRESAEKIIACQKSDDELIAISDIVIQNNGSESELEMKVKKLFASKNLP